MKSIEEFIDARDIFGDLRNVANGMIANDYVNVEMSLRVGERILTKMEGFPVKDYVFKNSDKTIQIPFLSKIKIGNETTNTNPKLLFQRMVSSHCNQLKT